MKNRFAKKLAVLFLFLLSLSPSFAAISPQDLPSPASLEPWKAWVLYKHPERSCPFYFQNEDDRRCVWIGEITLDIQKDKALFEQKIKVYQAAWVSLPGNQDTWPAEVTIDGKSAGLLTREGSPVLWLKPGEYLVKGLLPWALRPDHLNLPPGTGRLQVTLDGKLLSNLNWDEEGRLWLAPGAATKTEGASTDRVELRIFRKLIDGVPMQLVTQMQLQVAGSEREILIGQFQLPNSLAMSLASELPARIEKDGRLRVQVRPGTWVIQSTARFTDAATSLAIHPMDAAWPTEEVWVFEANRSLRTLKISGADAIDPQQTALPDDWKSLPAFLLTKDTQLKLDETHRGDPNPSPNQFHIQKTLWLDVSGEGITFKDEINGQMNQGWRLDMLPDFTLGRAEVLGQAQLITANGDEPGQGLELRQGQISLSALSRLASASTFSATGWRQDFLSAKGELRLPPGWRLMSMQGVDFVDSDWVSRWTLWDIFLVLMISIAFFRVVGAVWGLVSLLTLVAIYQEPNAPIYIWLNLLVLAALLKVFPENRFHKFLLWYRNASLVALALLLISFSVEQVRQAIYPQLEFPWMEINPANPSDSYGYASSYDSAPMVADQEPALERADVAAPALMDESQTLSDPPERAMKMGISAIKEMAPAVPAPRQQAFQYDSNAQIQTGPGEPTWKWRSVQFGWNGPVDADAQVSMLLFSPTINRLLKFLQVIFVLLLAFGVVSAGGKELFSIKPKSLPILFIGILLASLSLTPGQILHAEEFPDEGLLQELEQRLLAPSSCLPDCASIEKGLLQVSGDRLLLRLRIHAQEAVAIPLPIYGRRHTNVLVLVDGAPSAAIAQDPAGQSLLALAPGSHEVSLQVGLATLNQLDLPFSMPVHNLSVEAQQWAVSGLKNGAVPSGTLQLVKQVPQVTAHQNGLLPDPAPTFVEVERVVRLGLEWKVETLVRRLAPTQGAIHLNIPLVEGESITSGTVPVVEGQAQINLAADQASFRWESVLKQQNEIHLSAHKTQDWMETWWLDVTPIWHSKVTGIQPLKPEVSDGSRMPKWQPWPGESISIKISKPTAIEGNKITLESVRVESKVSDRSVGQRLQLQLRSSQGTEYGFQLPQNARIQKILLNGQEQALGQEGSRVQVPIQPGLQKLDVQWIESGDLGWRLSTPVIDLQLPSANIDLETHLPMNRWPLFVGGPSIGPAMLYWGMLFVLLLVAYGLGTSKRTPLKSYHWMLLVLGMSTSTITYGLVIVAWFFALAKRRDMKQVSSYRLFNLIQFTLVLLTIAAMGALFSTIPAGLLGAPDMQLVGNGSSQYYLHWFQDRSTAQLPEGWIWLAPMWLYRLLMLLWSLWLAFALMGWLKWGWLSFSEQGIWKFRPKIDTGKVAETVVAQD